jgi:hypothetical protein
VPETRKMRTIRNLAKKMILLLGDLTMGTSSGFASSLGLDV